MNIRTIVQSVIVLLFLAVPLTPPFQAETRNFVANVTRTLVSGDDRWGGCMAALSVKPADQGLNCSDSNWVTFSCTGEHAKKSSAQRMFDSAQMAFVTGRRVQVRVTDEKKHGGYCFVSRIDVLAK